MLPMQFGTPDHFRTDYINFVVADFEGTYHAILGRPALTKFMAIPHYRYLVLKMPTKKGVLTLRGNVYAAYTYEDDSFKIAEAHDPLFAWPRPCSTLRRPQPTTWRS